MESRVFQEQFKILLKNSTNLVQSGCEAILLRRNLRTEGQKRKPWGGEANGEVRQDCKAYTGGWGSCFWIP